MNTQIKSFLHIGFSCLIAAFLVGCKPEVKTDNASASLDKD